MAVSSEGAKLEYTQHNKFQWCVTDPFLAIRIVATDTDMFLLHPFSSGAPVQPAIPTLTTLHAMFLYALLPGTKKAKELKNV